MGLYLMIQNEGVADYNSLMLFGATGNRYSTNPMTIGTFGSGSKHSVGVLLRNNINLSIFAGLTKLNYYSKPKKHKKIKDYFWSCRPTNGSSKPKHGQYQKCCLENYGSKTKSVFSLPIPI